MLIKYMEQIAPGLRESQCTFLLRTDFSCDSLSLVRAFLEVLLAVHSQLGSSSAPLCVALCFLDLIDLHIKARPNGDSARWRLAGGGCEPDETGEAINSSSEAAM